MNIPAGRGSNPNVPSMPRPASPGSTGSAGSAHPRRPLPSIIDRCVAGEAEAWRELHREYRSMVTSSLRHLGVPPSDLEDAAQEVFLQVFRYLGRFQQRSELKTWLYKLCISQAGRIRRRRKLAAALGWLWPGRRDPEPGQAPAWSETPDWSEAELERRVRSALDRMKPLHRTVFVLYELEGLSGQEVAAVTALPFSTVRRRLHHARREFEAHIQNEERTP